MKRLERALAVVTRKLVHNRVVLCSVFWSILNLYCLHRGTLDFLVNCIRALFAAITTGVLCVLRPAEFSFVFAKAIRLEY